MRWRGTMITALALMAAYTLGSCTPDTTAGGATPATPTEAHLPVVTAGGASSSGTATTYPAIIDTGSGIEIDSSRYPSGATFTMVSMAGSSATNTTVCGRVVSVDTGQQLAEQCLVPSTLQDGIRFGRLQVPFGLVSGTHRYDLQVKSSGGIVGGVTGPAEVLVRW